MNIFRIILPTIPNWSHHEEIKSQESPKNSGSRRSSLTPEIKKHLQPVKAILGNVFGNQKEEKRNDLLPENEEDVIDEKENSSISNGNDNSKDMELRSQPQIEIGLEISTGKEPEEIIGMEVKKESVESEKSEKLEEKEEEGEEEDDDEEKEEEEKLTKKLEVSEEKITQTKTIAEEVVNSELKIETTFNFVKLQNVEDEIRAELEGAFADPFDDDFLDLSSGKWNGTVQQPQSLNQSPNQDVVLQVSQNQTEKSVLSLNASRSLSSNLSNPLLPTLSKPINDQVSSQKIIQTFGNEISQTPAEINEHGPSFISLFNFEAFPLDDDQQSKVEIISVSE